MTPKEKLIRVHEILCSEYQCPLAYFGDLDPLSELVSSLLSHRTKNADSGRAFRALRELFPTWEAVRDAPVAEVEEAITTCTWPEQKAPRLQTVLKMLTESLGEPLSLDHLSDMSVVEARTFLESFPGVGPKTSAATLAFSRIRGRALPVDSHHHRVATRLGIIEETIPVGPAHEKLEALLPSEWDAQTVYDHHEVLMLHGQRVCFFRAPACGKCVVRHLCDYYAAHYGDGVVSRAGDSAGSVGGV